jgi:serine/threonine-protein kinase
MGRMFGSDRFMAPEEFTLDARIDQRTTVFTLGRLIQEFLPDGPPTLLEVAATACRDAPADRFASLPAFCAAWRAARSTTTACANRLRP